MMPTSSSVLPDASNNSRAFSMAGSVFMQEVYTKRDNGSKQSWARCLFLSDNLEGHLYQPKASLWVHSLKLRLCKFSIHFAPDLKARAVADADRRPDADIGAGIVGRNPLVNLVPGLRIGGF